MKKYQLYDGFTYISTRNGMNVLNGQTDSSSPDYELNGEFTVPCFNGIAYFKTECGCFKLEYPKYQELTLEDMDDIYDYAGFCPEPGEYGTICSAMSGYAKRISEKEFKRLSEEYPIKKSDYKHLAWLS